MFLPHPNIDPKITHSERISPSRTGSALKGGMVPFFQYRESFRFWERCFFLKTVVFLFFIDCWNLLCQKSAWLSRFRALFASKMAIVGFSGLSSTKYLPRLIPALSLCIQGGTLPFLLCITWNPSCIFLNLFSFSGKIPILH